MANNKKYTLGLVWGTHQYEVKSITNSIEFKPGQWLDVDEVAKVCMRPEWEVTISDNATLSNILGIISSHVVFNPV